MNNPNQPDESLAAFEKWLKDDTTPTGTQLRTPEGFRNAFWERAYDKSVHPAQPTSKSHILFRSYLAASAGLIAAGLIVALGLALLTSPSAPTQTETLATTTTSTPQNVSIWLDEEIHLYASLLEGFDPEAIDEISDWFALF